MKGFSQSEYDKIFVRRRCPVCGGGYVDLRKQDNIKLVPKENLQSLENVREFGKCKHCKREIAHVYTDKKDCRNESLNITKMNAVERNLQNVQVA